MRLKALLGVAALALAAPAMAQTVAITNAKIATGTGAAAIDGGTVVISGGRIVSVGRGGAPVGAQVVDAQGRWVTPGIIGGFSRLGLLEVDAVDPSNDTVADEDGNPFNASLDVTPGLNPLSVNIPINRIEGVTRAVVAPNAGQSVFAGQGAIITLGDADDIATKPRAFQFIELGEAGADIAGGSRSAAHAIFRNGLREALAYARNPGGYEGGKDRGSIMTALDAAALVPVVQGRMPALIHVERASDILRVIELKREFPNLKPILVGVSEGWMVADKIAAAGVPVIASAMNDLPNRFEMLGATQSNVGRMVKAGVKVALGMIDDEDGRQIRLLPQHAGNLVAVGRLPGGTGVTPEQALMLMTKAPADIFGLTDTGSLEAGKRADVVIWDGDPLELASAPVSVMIDGRQVPLTSRQTKLRDRYMPNRPDTMPVQYRR
ncbi:amidohydrolase family protein [Sphingoaurantiacus capsulatus]|uniref:Amidohydrolase family protein n=1 Tax=Sphingoaurantiacus capsulatus TaxID=1771310 RepID=A0ABV7XCX6_9SPHN